MADLLSELKHAFDDRIEALERQIQARVGGLEPADGDLREALRVMAAYPPALRAALEADWGRTASTRRQLDATRDHLNHLGKVSRLFDRWFEHGADKAPPRSLARAVADELQAAGSRWNALLAVGPPGEFETVIHELYEQLFPPLGVRVEATLRKRRFALIQVPPLEAGQALFRPIVIGHELAHLLLEGRRRSRLDAVDVVGAVGEASTFGAEVPPDVVEYYESPDNVVETIARAWLEELVCDAYAMRRFGPAAIVSLASFIDATGGGEAFHEHPPTAFRLEVLLNALGPVKDSRISEMLRPARDRSERREADWPPWVQLLVEAVGTLTDEIPKLLRRWPEPYAWGRRTNRITRVAERLKQGVPSDSHPFAGGAEMLSPGDILNGAWLAWSENSPAPIDQLALKSLETLEFGALWKLVEAELRDAGRLPAAENEDEAWIPAPNVAGVEFGGVLPQDEIERRLDAGGGGGGIEVVPRPRAIQGTAMDMRLGNRFIVFEPSGIAAFDPIDPATNPRALQGVVEKDWGEPFVLHPGELVLAATHEYVSLPGDLSCLVVTRSSYGRLGLVTATAVLVHPYFQGCLTLELVNLGTVPLILTPGERLAQLTFLRVHEPVDPPSSRRKYRCPTGPEFSKIQSDPDATVLAAIRERRLHPKEGGT